MIRSIAIAAAASLTLAIPVAAHEEAVPARTVQPMEGAPGSADVSRVEAGTYKVDPGHTLVTFTVDHLGFSSYTGQFGDPSGTLVLDPANPEAAEVEIVFPISGVSTTSDELDAHLKSDDFFDAANHPDGRFVATGIEVNGTSATITGDLTLRGVTRPVTLDTQFYGAGANPMSDALNIGFRATTQLKRSDYGIDFAIPVVSDTVLLEIDAAFVKQPE